MDRVSVTVVRLSPTAIIPTRGSAFSAGSDLYAAHSTTLQPHQRVIVPTDLRLIIRDTNYYGRIAPRSGLAANHGIDVLAGVIDSDYRGPIGVVLINHGDAPYEVKQGDRVAQLILERIALPVFEEGEQSSETDRGSGGFGSTGK